MKRLAILGSTGSIGRSTLQVVRDHRERFEVRSLAAGRNLDLLEAQVREHAPRLVTVADELVAREAMQRFGDRCEIAYGVEGMERAARDVGADMAVCGLVGAVGMRPALAALDAGVSVALANKEALVVGGAWMTERARERGARILPVDSEHNALHQCLRGERVEEIGRLWLTASGGPFRKTTAEELRRVRVEDALRHPTWKMGPKITVDSATLMNKGLEVIEARWLFDVPAGRIRVVVHPQSVVHSMVELVDGSFKAQLGVTDMRHPIQYALSWPERWPAALEPFDPVAAGRLEFEEPDTRRFPCLGLAYRALEAGGAAPAVLNAANEVAVQAFLDGAAGFTDIPAVIADVLDELAGSKAASLEDVLEADRLAREAASRRIASGVRT